MRLDLPSNKKKLRKVIYSFLSSSKCFRVDRLNFKTSLAREKDNGIKIDQAIEEALDGRKFSARLLFREWTFEAPYWELSLDYSVDGETDRFIWIDVTPEQCDTLKKIHNLKEFNFN